MYEKIKTYQSYTSAKRHGIRCAVNIPEGSYPLHRHDYFEFEIIKKGSMIHELNGTREILRKGDIIALSPKDLHRFTVIDPVEICNFCVYYKDAPSVIENLISSVKFPLRGTFSDSELESSIELFSNALEQIKVGGDFEQEIVTAYTLLFLTQVLSVAKTETAHCAVEGYTHIVSAMEFISKNLTSHISLNDVSNYVHLTPNYFSKLFAEISGKSFIHYLTQQRIEFARHLLASTNDRVTDIAFASGFGSFSAFSRAFRTHCGVTQNEFRKYAQLV
jgi:AraC-like DNA-binding protein